MSSSFPSTWGTNVPKYAPTQSPTPTLSARLGWGLFDYTQASGSWPNNLTIVDPSFELPPNEISTSQTTLVSDNPINTYGRLTAPLTCPFYLYTNTPDQSGYTINVVYGPPGFDAEGAAFLESTLNSVTCPVTWLGTQGTVTLPAMDKPCTGVLGQDEDVRIYLIKNSIVIGSLLLNVIDVPNSSWPWQVPVWLPFVDTIFN